MKCLGLFRMQRRLRAGVLALVAGTAVALPASAQAYIYWSASDSTVGRANLDGSGLDSEFIPTSATPYGVAVDDDYVYWANNNGFSVGRASLDGTGVDQDLFSVATGNFVRGIDVDENYVYAALANDLGRADLDGANVNETFIDDLGTYFSVAVNDTHIYFIAFSNGIARANLDGTGVTQGFISGASNPRQVALDDKFVYWTNQTPGTIGRAKLDGTDVNQSFITGASAPVGLAVDDDHIYWTNSAPANTGSIGRANIDGSGVNHGFMTGLTTGNFSEIAVDELVPPATSIDSVDLNRQKRKAKIGFSSSQPDSTFTCKLDKRPWRKCDSPQTFKRLSSKRHRVKVTARNAENADDPTPAKVRFRL